MRVLITGNMGYVGPEVVRYLRQCDPNAELIGYDSGLFAGCLTTGSRTQRRCWTHNTLAMCATYPASCWVVSMPSSISRRFPMIRSVVASKPLLTRSIIMPAFVSPASLLPAASAILFTHPVAAYTVRPVTKPGRKTTS